MCITSARGGRPPPAPRGLATPPKGGPKQGPSYMKDELLKLSRGLEAARLKTREAEKALHAELQKAPEEAQEVITSLSLGCRGLEMCLGSPLLEKAKVNSKPFFRHIFLEVLDP
ncbi:hypothetical protein GW17_00029056 [Ensete ventricosum]|nr:hypothetical protein GW17_00029056 [Ensete ventricosum]RZR82092.1 hypothetical protein BHM03_00008448 [Ensete ventricosum]